MLPGLKGNQFALLVVMGVLQYLSIVVIRSGASYYKDLTSNDGWMNQKKREHRIVLTIARSEKRLFAKADVLALTFRTQVYWKHIELLHHY